jgi:hypothetical protein
MEDERDPFERTFYHRVMQAKIGQALKEQYGQNRLSQPLPHRLLTLLMQLNEQESTEFGEHSEQNKRRR